MSEGPRGQPAAPGECGSGPKALRVDQLSWATQARALGPAVSTNSAPRLGVGSDGPWWTSSPGRLAPMPDVPWGRPAAPGDSAPVPRAHWVEQMSWATPAQVRGHTWSTKYPGQFGLRSEGPRGRPTVPGDLGPCPTARGINQLSLVTLAHARGAAVSNSCFGRLALGPRNPGSTNSPGRLGFRSEGPWGQPAVPGDSGPRPRPKGSTSCPGRLGPGSECPRGRPAVPGISRLGLRPPRGRPAVPDDSGSCPRPVKSTCGCGCFGPEPYGTWGRPALPGDWGPGPKALVVDQLLGDMRTSPRARGVDQHP